MLKSLTVQHFRSLTNVKLALHPVTVIVGPNGSGKSNIIDSLRFLRDAIESGIEHAIDERGGASIVRQFSITRPYKLQFDLEVYKTFDGGRIERDSYHLRFSCRDSGVVVESESIDWHEYDHFFLDEDDSNSYHEELVHHKATRDESGNVYLNGKAENIRVGTDSIVLGQNYFHQFYGQIGSPLASFLRKMRFASVYPNIMREPARLETDRVLREDCSNWGSIIKHMRKNKKRSDSLIKIIDLMGVVLPGLKNIVVRNVGGYVVPQFLVEDRPGIKGHHLDPTQLSDGTLRIFGLLLHLYQVPAPTVLSLEEPEQTIHPGLLSVLVDAIREVSDKTQIVLTTHSPNVLDFFDTESIRVTRFRDGESNLYNMKNSQKKSIQQGLMTVAEIMSLDGIQPENGD